MALVLGVAIGVALRVGAGWGARFAGVLAGAPHAPEASAARTSVEIEPKEDAKRGGAFKR
jgi:hypothetical protein